MGIEKETPVSPAPQTGVTDPKKEEPSTLQMKVEDKVDEKAGVSGVFDRVKDSEVNWGMAQLLAGGLLIGLAVVWYVRRRSTTTTEHSKYAE